MLSNCCGGEDSWESLGQQGDQTVYPKGNQLSIFTKNSCWSWSSNALAIWCEEPSHWKRPWCWERFRAGSEGATEDEMVGWHHHLSGHEFEQTQGDSEGRGSLVCFSPWGCKELDTTEQLNSNNNHLGCIHVGIAFQIKVLFFLTEVTYFPIKR